MSRKGHAPSRKPPAAPVTLDRWVLGLAAAGFVVSAYLAAIKLFGTTAAFCQAGGGCDVVQSSRYSVFFGAPTAAWGAVFYLAIGALAAAGWTTGRWLTAFLLAVAGVGFSAYLTWIEFGVLSAVCGYCVASALISVALLVALVLRKPRAVAHRGWGAPVRLATLGVVVAVATIAFTWGAFLADTPQEASAKQQGLARHLAATGAIFYGAYW